MAVQRYRFLTDYRSGYGNYSAGQVIEPTKMSRDQLNAYAAGKGVAEPEKLANKDEVLAAIEGTSGEPDEADAEAETRAVETPTRNRRVSAPTEKRGA
jgi:hypothetical protein